MDSISNALKRKFRNPKMRAQYVRLFEQVVKNPEVAAFIKANQDRLSKEDIAASFSKLYEFVNLHNEMENGKQTFAPGYEPQLIVSDHHVEVVYQPTKDLLKKRENSRLEKRVGMINLPKSLRNARIEDYELKGREEPLRAALTFIDQCIDYQRNGKFPKGLYLSGSLGVGKTFLLAAIANKLAANDIQSLMVHFPSFTTEMSGSIQKGNLNQVLGQIKKVPVLMLDDIGANRLTSWMRDDILGIILEYRMQNELPTLFSSNLSMKELQEQGLAYNNRGDQEPLRAMRIMERIKFLSVEYQMIGPNRRNPE